MTQESISSTSSSITPLARRLSSKSLTPDQLHSMLYQRAVFFFLTSLFSSRGIEDSPFEACSVCTELK